MNEEKAKPGPMTFKCGECGATIPEDFLKQSHCPECALSYCKSHYPHGEWYPISNASDSMLRSATCPKGHERMDEDVDGDDRRIRYGR